MSRTSVRSASGVEDLPTEISGSHFPRSMSAMRRAKPGGGEKGSWRGPKWLKARATVTVTPRARWRGQDEQFLRQLARVAWTRGHERVDPRRSALIRVARRPAPSSGSGHARPRRRVRAVAPSREMMRAPDVGRERRFEPAPAPPPTCTAAWRRHSRRTADSRIAVRTASRSRRSDRLPIPRPTISWRPAWPFAFGRRHATIAAGCPAPSPTSMSSRWLPAKPARTGDQSRLTIGSDYRGTPLSAPLKGEKLPRPARVKDRKKRWSADGMAAHGLL